MPPTITFPTSPSAWAETMFTEMFNNRLTERTKNPESALIYGYNYAGSWVRNVDGLNIGAGVKPGMIEQGLEEVLVELERVLRYGFTESEFERQKRTSIKQIETQYNERDKTDSGDLRWQFLDIFFDNKNEAPDSQNLLLRYHGHSPDPLPKQNHEHFQL